MEKRRFSLSFGCKLVIGICLILSICLFVVPEYYEKSITESFDYDGFSFLQEGDYVLRASYDNAPEGYHMIVFTDSVTDSSNQIGWVYADVEMPAGSGHNTVEVPISLDRSAEHIMIRMEYRDQDEGRIADGQDAAEDGKAGDGQDAGEDGDGQNAGESGNTPEGQAEGTGEEPLIPEPPVMTEVNVKGTEIFCRDNQFLGGICLAIAVIVLLFGLTGQERKLRIPLLLVGMGLAASFPMMNDFLKRGHDLAFHLTRIEGIYQGMSMGQFPVRVNPVQLEGYGNITGIMYPQLFLFFPAALRFLGVSTMLAYKVLVVCINIATALLTFLAVRRISRSEAAGWVASGLYTFSLYRLIDAYTRASLGELLAMAFMPLVVWGIYEILWNDQKKWYLLMLGMTGILQSHVLSVEMTALFLILELGAWILTRHKTKVLIRLGAGILAAAVTVLLNAGFLIPFLYYSGEEFQVFTIRNSLAPTAAYFSQIFTSFADPTGVNLATGMTQGEMPITVGGILLLGSIAFCLTLRRKEKQDAGDRMGKHCLVYGLLCLLMSSWLFPWGALQANDSISALISPLQYVWRFLGPASLFLCLTSAVGIVNLAKLKTGREWVYGVAFLLVFSSASYYFSQVSVQMGDWNDKMEISGRDDTDSLYLYMETGANYYHRSQANIQCSEGSQAAFTGYVKEGTHLNVDIVAEERQEDGFLKFPVYYYPGYEVRIDGEPVEVLRQDTMLACELTEEMADGAVHHIEVEYVGFPQFDAADLISAITAVLLVMTAAVYVVVLRVLKKKAFFAEKNSKDPLSE